VLSAADQLQRIEDRLLQTGGMPRREAEAITFNRDLKGALDLALTYPSGHELHVHVAVDVSYGYPIWTSYRFHLQDRYGRCVFRYDSAPHYPRMRTFPHHKHVGPSETAQEHHQPGLGELVDEILQHVGS
jgi:hypothetical protein